MRPMVTAVCGGIGSGKSVVCRILRAMGYAVYDCDSRARAIMDSDDALKRKIAGQVAGQALLADGSIDRKALADVVFNDRRKLETLNTLVHGAVRDDIREWIRSNETAGRVFVETAILYQSGLDRMVDEVWEVTAPEHTRVERVCRRNGITPDEVRARIESQMYTPEAPHARVMTINNDGQHSLIARINALLDGKAL